MLRDMKRLVQIKTRSKTLSTKQRAEILSNPHTMYCDRKNNTCYWSSNDNPDLIIKNILK